MKNLILNVVEFLIMLALRPVVFVVLGVVKAIIAVKSMGKQ